VLLAREPEVGIAEGDWRLAVLALDGRLTAEAADASRKTGLLTNDALVVAVMERRRLTHLASNDADFDRVPGISRYAPA
jgi:predicted nucleic acid-binding protein